MYCCESIYIMGTWWILNDGTICFSVQGDFIEIMYSFSQELQLRGHYPLELFFSSPTFISFPFLILLSTKIIFYRFFISVPCF